MNTASPALPGSGPAAGLPLDRLSPRVLLGVYLVVPVLLLFILLDALVTGLDFSRRISFDNKLFLVVSLLLQTPHAMASLFTFADREYVSAYRWTLFKCGLVGVATLATILIVGDTLFALCLVTYNFYHQSSQQAGIAAMIARNKPPLHQAWRWMSVVILLAGFLAIMARNEPGVHVAEPLKQALVVLAALFMAAFGWITLRLARQSQTPIGRRLILAQGGMLFVYVFIYMLNLPLLMALAPVVVHDFTAFAFYINHNHNRNREVRHNLFSRLRNIVPLREVILTPLVAFTLGLCIMLPGMDTFAVTLWATLWNVMHIYVEGVIWKAGSPHRQYTLV